MKFAAVCRLLGIVAAVAVSASSLLAQQPPAGQPKAPPKAASPAAAPAPGQKAAASPSSDNPLRSRVEQLEEQLVDLQVTIGTLESLARTTGTSAASPGYRAPPPLSSGGGDTGGVASRVDGLEIQLRALVGQVEQLTDQVRTLNGRRAAGPASPGGMSPPSEQPPRVAGPGFGSTTVTPGGGDQIGKLLTDEPPRATPAVVPGGDPGNAKQLYETAYGYLLQQNYGAAETAFEDFLVRHPQDQLAGNAQYWLGESHFVRGQYKQAAGAFLKGYQTYARSAKAPDSLLKLAMSLDRLGQKDAACSSYGELNTRFPNAPQNIKGRADSERRRIGCP
jgi:tol-pal system protein YbgF